MSRVIWLLICAVVAIGVIQWGGPMVLDQTVADAIEQRIGTVPTVDINAVPIWDLTRGQFDTLAVSSGPGKLGDVAFQAGSLVWQHGGLDLPTLLAEHRLVVTRLGTLRLSMQFSQQQLSQLMVAELPKSFSAARIHLTPQSVSLEGGIVVSGTTVPINTSGILRVASDRQSIFFEPQTFDGFTLPFLAQIQVFRVQDLHFPMALSIQTITVQPGALSIQVDN